MSIKYKLPLLLLLAFLLNIILLLGYYQFYLEGRVETFQNKSSLLVENTSEEILAQIEGKSLQEAQDYLSSIQTDRGLKIMLQNEKEQLESGVSDENGMGFTATKLVHLKDGYYLLKIEKTVDFLNFKAHNLIMSLILFEILVVFIIFVILSLVIHFSYVKRLLRLDKQMRAYKSGEQVDIAVKGQDEIGQLQGAFLRLTVGIREEKQKQNRIIASISHDLKTPLTSVLGYSERVWKKDLGKEKQQLYLSTIYKQARDIEAIVEEFEDYLGVAVLDKKQQQIYRINYIEKMLKEEYADLFQEKNGSIVIQNRCQEKVAIEVELLKIRRVFANIFGNAIRHCKTEFVHVTVDIFEKEEKVVFSIADDGVGVSKEELPHLFEPFFTSDKSRQISGLGLSICKQIINGHDGEIVAKQNTEGGLTIVFELPQSMVDSKID